MDILYVAIGGLIGAISRFVVVNRVSKHMPSSFPYGTLIVNVIGSFLLGLLYGLAVSVHVKALVGAGFLGAFTTFSTFQYEIVQLRNSGKWKEVFFYISGSVLIGIAVAALGFWLGCFIQ